VSLVTASAVVGLPYSGPRMRVDTLRRSAGLVLLLLCAALQVRAVADPAPDPDLLLGVFPIKKVSDGDTLRVVGLDDSLRLIGLDTEETFKRAADRRAADADWPGFLRALRGAAPRPVKGPSPLGEEARRFAVRFFAGVDQVRLERDHPAERRDSYGRHLAYALVRQDGRWVNYNVEAVRAGMSPYFTKYGHATRYHREMLAAEHEARAAGRGIWDPDLRHYTDYEERRAWWNARGTFIEAFRSRADERHIVLWHDGALDQLRARLGSEVEVLAISKDMRDSGRGPTRVLLATSGRGALPLIFFDPDVLTRSRLPGAIGEPLVVRGVVTEYRHRRSGDREIQILVRDPAQITLAPVPGPAPPQPPPSP
jgi:endonuclease YncB( thermonuclease family)